MIFFLLDRSSLCLFAFMPTALMDIKGDEKLDLYTFECSCSVSAMEDALFVTNRSLIELILSFVDSKL